MCHDLLANLQCCIFCHICTRDTLCGIDPLDLGCLHFHVRTFLHMHDRLRIHDIFAVTVTFSVVAFNITDMRTLFQIEGMYPCMKRCVHAAVVDSTACHNRNI